MGHREENGRVIIKPGYIRYSNFAKLLYVWYNDDHFCPISYHQGQQSIQYVRRSALRTVYLSIGKGQLTHICLHSVSTQCVKTGSPSQILMVKNTKKERTLNITPYGGIFYQLTYWDKM